MYYWLLWLYRYSRYSNHVRRDIRYNFFLNGPHLRNSSSSIVGVRSACLVAVVLVTLPSPFGIAVMVVDALVLHHRCLQNDSF
jgi:hypothetical protein